ncbi:MAG: hypothetical protein N7Q72_03420, partial [Spiroplasma sp. Tabriz.8]|nr:hypothetical protein [Candidatus Karelsulcia muelleri]MCZ8632293.1 hypothetical protein [Spiroplasma sp. Tabriz.8]
SNSLFMMVLIVLLLKIGHHARYYQILHSHAARYIYIYIYIYIGLMSLMTNEHFSDNLYFFEYNCTN